MVLRTLFSYLQPSWVDANLGRCSGWHVTMTYLCIGSALFHALTTKWPGMLDVIGIWGGAGTSTSPRSCSWSPGRRSWSSVAGDRAPLPFVAVSLALFVAGYGSWEADKRRRFVPRPWVHGFWHLFTAAASAVVFYAIDCSVGP